MVPRITTLIRSSEIAVERKRNAKRKKPLKRIKTVQRRSSIGQPFSLPVQRGIRPRKQRGPFCLPGGHFETADQLLENRRFAKNRFPKQGTDHRKAKFPHRKHRFAITKSSS